MRRSARRIIVDLVIAVLFVGAAGSVAWLLSVETFPTYQATVWLAVVPDPLVAGDDPDAYDRAVRSEDVLRAALARMGAVQPTARQIGSLRDLVSTEILGAWPGSATFHVGVTGPTPEVAEGRAEAVAAALREWDRVDRLVESVDALETRISTLTTELRTEQVLGAGSDQSQIFMAQRTLAIERRDRAQASLASDEPTRTLERVGTETTQIAARPAQNAALAATIAALASLVLFVRLPRRGGRRLAPLPRATARPAPPGAGPLARFPRGRSEHDPALRAAADHLCTAVLGRADEARPRVILLTGIDERSGVTVVACRLAEELARKGRRTLLVDGNLGSPGIADRYGLDERPADGKPAATTVEWLQHPGAQHCVATVQLDGDVVLYVVPQFRPMRPAPGAGEALFAGLATARERWAEFDVIVMDSAPLTVAEDTRLLASRDGRGFGRAARKVGGTAPERGPEDASGRWDVVSWPRRERPAAEPQPEREPEPEPEPAAGPEDERDAFYRAFGPRDRTSGRRRERLGEDRGDGDR